MAAALLLLSVALRWLASPALFRCRRKYEYVLLFSMIFHLVHGRPQHFFCSFEALTWPKHPPCRRFGSGRATASVCFRSCQPRSVLSTYETRGRGHDSSDVLFLFYFEDLHYSSFYLRDESLPYCLL